MREYIVQAIEPETIDAFDAHNAPELIRCKECKKHGDISCPLWTDAVERETEDDWFCADGERRETE